MSHTIHGRIDLATGVYTPYAPAAPKAKPEPRPVDPETAAHEARHAAIALMHGVRVTEARADYPSADTAGHVLYSADTDPREKALMILAGEMGQPGWPPDWPSRSGPAGCDEHRLAELVDELDLDRRGWDALCAEAKNLVASPGIDQLKEMIEMFLAKGHVLNEDTLATFYNATCPPRSGVMAKFDATAAGLQHKSFATATDADSAGEFEALVAVFGNVDKGGDRILLGAFTKTLAAWRASGDPVPVIWSHEWGTPDSDIGVAYAKDMQQTVRGLHVKGQLDIDDNPVARRVHKLMQRRSVKEFSFGYSVPPGGQRKTSDGANELIEIDLFEIGPTLKGMNPATELHSVKGIAQATDDTLKARLRAETYALLTDGGHEPGALEAGTLEDRFDREQARRHQRELRRQCDRMRLDESLGWDTDLIKR